MPTCDAGKIPTSNKQAKKVFLCRLLFILGQFAVVYGCSVGSICYILDFTLLFFIPDKVSVCSLQWPQTHKLTPLPPQCYNFSYDMSTCPAQDHFLLHINNTLLG